MLHLIVIGNWDCRMICQFFGAFMNSATVQSFTLKIFETKRPFKELATEGKGNQIWLLFENTKITCRFCTKTTSGNNTNLLCCCSVIKSLWAEWQKIQPGPRLSANKEIGSVPSFVSTSWHNCSILWETFHWLRWVDLLDDNEQLYKHILFTKGTDDLCWNLGHTSNKQMYGADGCS